MKVRTLQTWRDNVLGHIKAVAGILGFVGLCIGLIVHFKGDTWREENIDICVLNGAYLAVISYLLWIILARRPPEFLGTPRVIKLMRSDNLLIVEGAPWISLGIMTAVYVVEDGVERLVCIGEVANVQFNGLVQVSLSPDERGYTHSEEIWQALDRADKKAILVKPRLYPGDS